MSKIHAVLLVPEEGDPHGLLEGRPYGARPLIAHQWYPPAEKTRLDWGPSRYDTAPWRVRPPRRTASLDFSVRVQNCLSNVHIYWLDQLLPMTDKELIRIKNLGKRSLNDLKEVLADRGLSTGMRLRRALVLAWGRERDTKGCDALAEVMSRGKVRRFSGSSIEIDIRDLLAYTDGRPFTGRDYGTLLLLDAEGQEVDPPPPRTAIDKAPLLHLRREGTDMAACGKKVEDFSRLRNIDKRITCSECLESKAYAEYRSEWRAWKEIARTQAHQDELRNSFTYVS
jgi:hypothetical protein